MNDKAQIRKVLVVLSPDLIRPDQPEASPLLQRAASLAKTTGCEVELFHVCYDDSLEDSLFQTESDLERERKRLTDRDATQLAEIAKRFGEQCANVSFEVRWDQPRTDAILRKIAHAEPDLVLKQGRDYGFVLGVSTNTDWELARRSPAPIWLVNDEVKDIDKIVAAVGTQRDDPTDITTSRDYALLRMAGQVAESFDAAIHPVNAWRINPAPGIMTGIDGMAAVPASEQQKLRDDAIRKHSGAVKALVKYFDIPRDNVHIREGRPEVVIPDVVDEVSADLVILGARSIGRLERVIGRVTVEPVMSRTDCDVLIVREGDASHVPATEKKPLYGKPRVDVERAITHPEATFKSPHEVVKLDGLSTEMRQRILQAWEYDIRAEMAEENEGGPVRDIDVSVLDELIAARSLLQMQNDNLKKAS